MCVCVCALYITLVIYLYNYQTCRTVKISFYFCIMHDFFLLLPRKEFKLVDNTGVLSTWKSAKFLTKQSEFLRRRWRDFDPRLLQTHWTEKSHVLCLANSKRADFLDFAKGRKNFLDFAKGRKNSEKAVRRLLTARIYPHMQLSISFRISSQFIYR